MTSRALTLRLEGLRCASCVSSVEKALAATKGVASADVNLATGQATIQVHEKISSRQLADAVEAVGFGVSKERARLRVDGLRCGGCVRKVEDLLFAQSGVVSCAANLASHSADVEYFSGAQDPAKLARALSDAGYEAQPLAVSASTEQHNDAETAALGRATLLAAGLSLPVFVLEMGGHLIPGFHSFVERSIGHQQSWLLQFLLTTLLLIGPGQIFFANGLPALWRGAPEMNSLVALGAGAAWIYSAVAVFAPQVLPEAARAVYFEAAAVVTTLILFGRWLEAHARGRAGAAIELLVSLRPRRALVERDGVAVESDIDMVEVGEVLRLRPGERVAVDGLVLSGSTYVDESLISGEPLPTHKQAGDSVVGGTVNGAGSLRYRATAVGAETMLAQIIAMVERAQGAKLPIQALVDRVTGVFVPIVMAIALATVVLWLTLGSAPSLGMALVAGVSVLIIACPCAMGLATPMSIIVGTDRAASLGVLLRRGEALQRLELVRVVALDKTGR